MTQAFTELRTLEKRIQKKQEKILRYLYRTNDQIDPFGEEPGSKAEIQKELQSIEDLWQRYMDIRKAMRKANEETFITIEGVERSMADWVAWKREVAPKVGRFIQSMVLRVYQGRDEINRENIRRKKDEEVKHIVINVDEKALSDRGENIEKILGALDGQLAVKNATVTLDIPDEMEDESPSTG